MKKVSFLIIVVISSALLFGAWKAYDGIYFKKDAGTMTIKCRYMAYACGDCYPQWRTDSSFAAENDLKELIEESFYVIYKGKGVDESFPDSINKCIICYDFYFTGLMKKTLIGKYKFETDSFQVKMDSPDCCN